MSRPNPAGPRGDLELDRLAELTGLSIDDARRERLARALDTMVEYFDLVSGEAAPEGGAGGPVEVVVALDDLRADVPVPSEPGRVVAASPDFEEEVFFVPRVAG